MTLNINIKSEAQQKKLKSVRGSYTDLDLSIHVKKEPPKSHETLPLIFGLQGKQQDCTLEKLKSCSCFHHLLKLKGSVHIAKQYTAKPERATESTWNHIQYILIGMSHEI